MREGDGIGLVSLWGWGVLRPVCVCWFLQWNGRKNFRMCWWVNKYLSTPFNTLLLASLSLSLTLGVFLYLPLFPHSIYSVVKRCQLPKWTDHKRVGFVGRLVASLACFRLFGYEFSCPFKWNNVSAIQTYGVLKDKRPPGPGPVRFMAKWILQKWNIQFGLVSDSLSITITS